MDEILNKFNKLERAFKNLEKNIRYDDYLEDLILNLETAIEETGLALEDLAIELNEEN